MEVAFVPSILAESAVGNVAAVHPLGLSMFGVAAVGVLFAPRRALLGCVLLLAMTIPAGQRLVVAGADLPFLRMLALIAALRLAAEGSFRQVRWGPIDLLVLLGAILKIGCAPVTIGASALVPAIGASIEPLGIYAASRACIRRPSDLRDLAIAALLCAIPIVGIFLIERFTGRNMLFVFGGVPEFTAVREGKLRCQGAFSHAILAGCFFVALIPLWIGLWRTGPRGPWLAASGAACGLLVVFACASSTPVVALLAALMAFAAYPAWRHLRMVWIAGLVVAVFLNFLMSHGVWHLIARIDLVGGSTGYHRYKLIDGAISHFGEWWIAGTASTVHWGRGLQDITNQYILEGVRGGFGAMLCLLAAVVFALRGVGRSLRHIDPRSPEHFVAYCCGVAIFAQAFIFLAVSYFGQTVIVWSITLAAAAMWGEPVRLERTASAEHRGLGPHPSVPARRRQPVAPLPLLAPEPRRGASDGA